MPKKKQPRRRSRKPSERAVLERSLGHKLLTGQIPVVPPSRLKLPRCPVPPNKQDEMAQTCKDYEEGKIGYEEVLARVGESLKKPEPPKPESPSPEKNEPAQSEPKGGEPT